MFDMLMGDQVAPRKKFIQTHAKYVRDLDVPRSVAPPIILKSSWAWSKPRSGHLGFVFVPVTFRLTRAAVGRLVTALEAKLAAYPGEHDLANGETWL